MKKYKNIKFSFLPSFKRVSVILSSANESDLKAKVDIVKILDFHVYSFENKSLLNCG